MTMTATGDNTLVLTTPSDREVVGVRVFDAPPELVFRVQADGNSADRGTQVSLIRDHGRW